MQEMHSTTISCIIGSHSLARVALDKNAWLTQTQLQCNGVWCTCTPWLIIDSHTIAVLSSIIGCNRTLLLVLESYSITMESSRTKTLQEATVTESKGRHLCIVTSSHESISQYELYSMAVVFVRDSVSRYTSDFPLTVTVKLWRGCHSYIMQWKYDPTLQLIHGVMTRMVCQWYGCNVGLCFRVNVTMYKRLHFDSDRQTLNESH